MIAITPYAQNGSSLTFINFLVVISRVIPHNVHDSSKLYLSFACTFYCSSQALFVLVLLFSGSFHYFVGILVDLIVLSAC